MVKLNTQKRCPNCGYPKPLLKQTCPNCGNDLTSPKIKVAKKFLKGTNIITRSIISKEYRERTLNKLQSNTFNLNQFDLNNTKSQNNNYGYLLCDTCPIYYKLNKPLSEYKNRTCGCGGNLIYSKKSRYE